jgi:hypothetical protein
MFQVKDSIQINAPADRCFLLSTSIPLVARTIGLQPTEGRTTGLALMDDRILWRGWKFGLPALHETLITAYQRPTFFQDTMGSGRFRSFQHDHHFEPVAGRTLLHDEIRFTMLFGPLGRLVARAVVIPHIAGLLSSRLHLIKRLAEGEEWRQYLPDTTP